MACGFASTWLAQQPSGLTGSDNSYACILGDSIGEGCLICCELGLHLRVSGE